MNNYKISNYILILADLRREAKKIQDKMNIYERLIELEIKNAKKRS